MLPDLLSRLLAVATVGFPLTAQHLVGPGGFAQIRDALQVAQPGDVIHVQPGTYAQFRANMGVTIRALVPGSVVVAPDPAYYGPCLVCSAEAATHLAPPVGQELHVVGLQFVTVAGQPTVNTWVQVTGGQVTLDECSISGSGLVVGSRLLLVSGAQLHLQRCTIDYAAFASGFAGIDASNAAISATDSSIVVNGPFTNGHCIRLTNSTLHGSHLVLRSQFESAVLATGSTVWVSDSEIRTLGATHCAVVGGATTSLSRCTIVAAAGCPQYPAANPQLGASRLTPLAAGGVLTTEFRTAPNGFVLVWAGAGLDAIAVPAVVEQPIWLASGASFALALLVADAQGVAQAAWPIPAGPGITDQRLWLQGYAGTTLPLASSPVLGGVVR